MMTMKRAFAGLLAASFLAAMGAAQSAPDGEALFKQHCAACHGSERLGGMGPALLPGNLKRLRKNKAVDAIANGLPATQMPAFGATLKTDQIAALADYIYTKPAVTPSWTEDDIRASQVVLKPELVEGDATTAKPIYDADPLNVFLVVESGDHHVSVLDGDKMEPIHRFKSRFALHGGPKYSSDGRFVYFASRDGWITKYDMYKLEVVAEVRAGINTRNAAVSSNNRYVMVGNYLPHNLVLLDARDLSLIKTIEVGNGLGKTSRVSAVYDARPRESFIAALKDMTEVWEISYSDEPAFHGWSHDYRQEYQDQVELFPVRRIPLKDYLDDFFFDQTYDYLIGAARSGRQGQVVDLVVGKKVADIALPGMPHLGSGISWKWGDTTILATPNLKDGVISFIDMATWKTIKRIDTLGPGFFMRSHANSPYAWVDVFFGPHKDVVHVIDKKTLEIAKTLKPEPGKTSGHIEFTRDGKYALLSIWEKDGAVIVYDGDTLEEVKRLPMSRPVGKYNVWNKITREEGTSH